VSNALDGGAMREITDPEKAALLDVGGSLDSGLPQVRALAAAVCGAGSDPAEAVRRALRFAQTAIRYVRDTLRTPEDVKIAGKSTETDEFAASPQILKRRYGDCDDKARVLLAILRARRIESRVHPVFEVREFVHVQLECRYPGSENHPLAQDNGWLRLDPTAREALVGEAPPDTERRTGRLLVR
jgi:transglutaminase-like putative cysteine protease